MPHSCCPGHNMSVLGSQVDVDMDESVPDPVPKHQGHTGTGCYKLHDHEFMRPKHRVTSGTGGKVEVDKGPPTNIMDLPVDGGGQQAVQQLKHMASPAHRSPVRWSRFPPLTRQVSIRSRKCHIFGIIGWNLVNLVANFIMKIKRYECSFLKLFDPVFQVWPQSWWVWMVNQGMKKCF